MGFTTGKREIITGPAPCISTNSLLGLGEVIGNLARKRPQIDKGIRPSTIAVVLIV